MSTMDEGIDQELRGEFIDESLDGLQRVSALLVELEGNPGSQETIQAIFRPVHSIKGSSAFFGLLQTKALAHELETLLDLIRKGGLVAAPDVIGVLLEGVDELTAMLQRTHRGEAEAPDPQALVQLVERVRGFAGSERETEEGLWRGLFESIADLGDPALTANVQRVARVSVAGRKALDAGHAASKQKTDHWPEPAKRLASLLSDTAEKPDPDQARALFDACLDLAEGDALRVLREKALADFEVLARTVGLGDGVARSILQKHLGSLFPVVKDGKSTPPVGRAPGAPSAAAPAAGTEAKTMRIPEERIDAFLAHVGELVTIGEMYGHLQSNLAGGADSHLAAGELRRINEFFERLSLSLQHSIMQIRKLPLGGILGRAPRMVRDIASERGKQIEVVVTGGDIMVDKSHVDCLDAPLTHMVRNAADHGIELPDVRLAAGKPAAWQQANLLAGRSPWPRRKRPMM